MNVTAEDLARLHPPFGLLSDAGLAFAGALALPTFVADGRARGRPPAPPVPNSRRGDPGAGTPEAITGGPRAA